MYQEFKISVFNCNTPPPKKNRKILPKTERNKDFKNSLKMLTLKHQYSNLQQLFLGSCKLGPILTHLRPLFHLEGNSDAANLLPKNVISEII